jgi:hypothetical protein
VCARDMGTNDAVGSRGRPSEMYIVYCMSLRAINASESGGNVAKLLPRRFFYNLGQKVISNFEIQY